MPQCGSHIIIIVILSSLLLYQCDTSLLYNHHLQARMRLKASEGHVRALEQREAKLKDQCTSLQMQHATLQSDVEAAQAACQKSEEAKGEADGSAAMAAAAADGGGRWLGRSCFASRA